MTSVTTEKGLLFDVDWDASVETANRWYGISWWGLIICGSVAGFAALATVAFTFLGAVI